MTLLGDYSEARPGGSLLKRLGYHGVLRYVNALTLSFNLTTNEVADLTANVVSIGVVCEQQINFMLTHNGHDMAIQSQEWCHAVGLEDGPVYFAVDFDATNNGPTFPGSPGDNNMKQIANFLESAISAIGESRVGTYGSYFVLMWLRQHGFNLLEWQTAAWSQGLIVPGCEIYQHNTLSPVPIKDVDYDSTIVDYWGQRGVGIPTPPLDASRFDWIASGPTISYGTKNWLSTVALQKCLNRAVVPGFTPISIDGAFGSETLATLERYQSNRQLRTDGICGPVTWGDFRTLFLERGYASL